MAVRVYSYIVRYDFGFAPNPFHGWCTLATCKQDIRGRATVGDWVLGSGSKSKQRDGTLVYAMEVEEILTFDSYWDDPRFAFKRPNLRGSLKQQYGDNIYHHDPSGEWVQLDSRHSLVDGAPNPGHIAKDTRADSVLVSRRFAYCGGSGPSIPSQFRDWDGLDICQDRSGYRCLFPDEMRDAFVHWVVTDVGLGYRGDPLDW
jgi:putative DNA base modification enzyme with NMAD domain